MTTSAGKLQWDFKTGGQVNSDVVLNGDGSTVFFGSADKSFYAVDTATGNQIWRFTTQGSVRTFFVACSLRVCVSR